MKKINVLIVDDSLLIRKMFAELLDSDPDINVVGVAVDPYDAREKIKSLNPDVITLDIEMPKMDGLEFLRKIMSLRPMPVIMVSSLTQKGAEFTFEALEIGAVDYVPKTGSRSFDVNSLGDELIAKVKAAARARVSCPPKERKRKSAEPINFSGNDSKIIAIGSSTGGVEALGEVLPRLPANSPAVVVTQHMPEKFTKSFANRLDGICHVNVHEAKNSQKIEAGNVYIAPGNKHLRIAKTTSGYICKVNDDELVSGHRPSVDVLFNSVSEIAGDKAIGVILTGMGKDGAVGMLNMKKAGSFNIGQNENSCVVYGMPKAAHLAGAVDKQVALSNVAEEILKACE